MKGLMSPAVLVHRHHLTVDQVAHIYEALYCFSFGFHGLVHIIVQQATHSKALKESVWRTFAMLWQAALGMQFPTEFTSIIQVTQQSAATERGNSNEIERRCVAAGIRSMRRKVQNRCSVRPVLWEQIMNRVSQVPGDAGQDFAAAEHRTGPQD